MRASKLASVYALLALCVGLPAACGGGSAGTPTGALPPWVPPPAICSTAVAPVDVSSPTAVVGSGSSASCTEDAFHAALVGGGTVVFDCGDDPVMIELTETQVITEDTVIDGGGTVTLGGGGTTRILEIQSSSERTTPHLTVQNLGFVDGRARGDHTEGGGGAIYFLGGSLTVIDSQFWNNRCVDDGPDVAGGAIYGRGAGAIVIVGSRFVGNVGSSGGAVGGLGVGIEIVNSHFEANRAAGSVDMGGNGGAIYLDGAGRTLSVCGTSFIENESRALGGAMFRTGYETEPNPIDRSTFDGNYSLDGPRESSAATFYLQGVNVVVTNTTIANGRAAGGAGIRIENHGPGATGRLEMTNCTVTLNATYERGDFTMRGVSAGIGMGDGTEGTLRHCTIVDNAAQFGAGIWNAANLAIENSIISNVADNEWTPLNCGGSTPASGQNNLQWPMGMAGIDADCVTGIVYADPMLGDLADNGGPTPTRMPLPGSPAIGAGTACPATDQRGMPRNPTACTLGAVEP